MTSPAQSLFSSVEMAPKDPILGLTETFLADQRPEKVNLGVGVYYDDQGKLPLLKCVQAAEQQMLAFLLQHVPKAVSPMCGNSICQDRRFMARHMPTLEAFFHYRNVDVSTLKELCRRWRPELIAGFKKHQLHTALADIRESVEELRYYRQHFIRDH